MNKQQVLKDISIISSGKELYKYYNSSNFVEELLILCLSHPNSYYLYQQLYRNCCDGFGCCEFLKELFLNQENCPIYIVNSCISSKQTSVRILAQEKVKKLKSNHCEKCKL